MNMKMVGQLIRYCMNIADLGVEISGAMREIKFSSSHLVNRKKKKKSRKYCNFHPTVKYVFFGLELNINPFFVP